MAVQRKRSDVTRSGKRPVPPLIQTGPKYTDRDGIFKPPLLTKVNILVLVFRGERVVENAESITDPCKS